MKFIPCGYYGKKLHDGEQAIRHTYFTFDEE